MIVNGRLNKFFEEICLVDQGFVKENKMKVSKYVESKNMKILSFVRYEVGEGMEKKEENLYENNQLVFNKITYNTNKILK